MKLSLFCLFMAMSMAIFVPAVAMGTPITISIVSHGSDSITPTSDVWSDQGNLKVLNPNPIWDSISGAVWVSPYSSGNPTEAGFEEIPLGSMIFMRHEFILPKGFVPQSATLYFMASDTGVAHINSVVQNERGYGTAQETCETSSPGCLIANMLIKNVDVSLLQSAGYTNMLQFEVYKLFGESVGATWRLDVEGQMVPEPSTAIMIGVGLLAFAMWRKERHSK